jgi:hypothetical protein
MVGENVDKTRAVEAIMHAYELGVNYFDTGYYYCNKQSEEIVGVALREVRDKVYLSTKNPIEDSSGKNWRSRLERSLKLMGVDHIDFYHFNAMVKGKRYLIIEGSRGCEHSCKFCTQCAFWGNRWRSKSGRRIADEMGESGLFFAHTGLWPMLTWKGQPIRDSLSEMDVPRMLSLDLRIRRFAPSPFTFHLRTGF